MSNWSPDWWWGLNRTTSARARQIPVLAHEGDHWDFLRRHERAAREAALSGPKAKQEYAKGLLTAAADPRNLKCAIEHVIRKGDKAPGPNGLRPETLSAQEQWELAKALAKAITTGKYRPGPVRRKNIPKTSGIGTRPLDSTCPKMHFAAIYSKNIRETPHEDGS
jgi:hypothetical protein